MCCEPRKLPKSEEMVVVSVLAIGRNILSTPFALRSKFLLLYRQECFSRNDILDAQAGSQQSREMGSSSRMVVLLVNNSLLLMNGGFRSKLRISLIIYSTHVLLFKLEKRRI